MLEKYIIWTWRLMGFIPLFTYFVLSRPLVANDWLIMGISALYWFSEPIKKLWNKITD